LLRNLRVVSVASGADGGLVIADGDLIDDALRVWDPARGALAGERLPFAGSGVQVVTTPAATYLVTSMRIWSRPAAGGAWAPGPVLPYQTGSMGGQVRPAALPDGRLAVLVADVLGPACTTGSVFSVLEVLQPATGRWVSAALPEPRVGSALAALPDGRLAVVGGFRRTLDGCGWSGANNLASDVLLVTPPR